MPAPFCVAPCRKSRRGMFPSTGADGIWMMPSRPPLPSPSGPLFSVVVTFGAGRALKRPSDSGEFLVATRHASPSATDAKAKPAVKLKWRRVTRVSTVLLPRDRLRVDRGRQREPVRLRHVADLQVVAVRR